MKIGCTSQLCWKRYRSSSRLVLGDTFSLFSLVNIFQSSKENSGVLNVVTVPLIQESFSPSVSKFLEHYSYKLKPSCTGDYPLR